VTALLGLPFLGLLLSIALLPGLAPRFWLRHMGWVALGWSVALLLLEIVLAGPSVAWAMTWHALLIDYLPFVTLLGGLYIAAGGVLLRGGPRGTPFGNTATLAFGLALGLVMGPTGGAMVVIQPLLAANAHRRRRMHLVLFLIVLVANISGALSPLGNPPLFVGLLRGVPLGWPLHHLLGPYLLLSMALLAVFYGLDRHLARDEPPAPPTGPPRVRGWGNAALVAILGLSVLEQGLPLPDVTVLGQAIGLGRLAGIGVACAAGGLSLLITPRAVRQANDFSWHPMAEVAVLFAGIFVTLEPVSGLLQTGAHGTFGGMAQGAPPIAYFWLTGVLSAFLDNAPTYLVFFDLAGIRPDRLVGAANETLTAISAGAVFFGGLTYIGNAPNLLLRAIAAHRGVPMPGFVGFMLRSAVLLLPLFALLSVVFFR
jgi:Na+/H+ antiporter NhaD/arsenite permease-like protein